MNARPGVSFARGKTAMDRNPGSIVARTRAAQQAWAAVSLSERLLILRRFRHSLAESAQETAATVTASPHRPIADTLAAEVLPLLEACRFLEREAPSILATRVLGNRTRPFWLRRVGAKILREPIGVILIIGPGNYPLFLPGVQALQALAAGNAVLWKPALGGSSAARAFQMMLLACGLDPSLLQILDESPATATAAIRAGVDKVLLTGSESTGRAVLHDLAESLTPSVMELSGCDAVFVLEGADLDRVIAALAFGMRLNGSATCMAPRRVFVTATVAKELTARLASAFEGLQPVHVQEQTSNLLQELMFDAESKGARFRLNGFNAATRVEGGGTLLYPTLVIDAKPEMRIAQTDIFAPVLSIIEVKDEDHAVTANSICPYALTASIFGPRDRAERLALRISVGSVVINDIIVSTADPRIPFGGRNRSGFGKTRGREGLLEMTAIKTILTQKSRDLRAYVPPTEYHASFIGGYIQAIHGGKWRTRRDGLRDFFRAMIKIR